MVRHITGMAAMLLLATPTLASELDTEFAGKASGNPAAAQKAASALTAAEMPQLGSNSIAKSAPAKGTELDSESLIQAGRAPGGRGGGGGGRGGGGGARGGGGGSRGGGGGSRGFSGGARGFSSGGFRGPSGGATRGFSGGRVSGFNAGRASGFNGGRVNGFNAGRMSG